MFDVSEPLRFGSGFMFQNHSGVGNTTLQQDSGMVDISAHLRY